MCDNVSTVGAWMLIRPSSCDILTDAMGRISPRVHCYTRAHCRLEKNKFLQPENVNGSQGVEVTLAPSYIRLPFLKCYITSELDGISCASSDHDRDSKNLQTGRQVTTVNREIKKKSDLWWFAVVKLVIPAAISYFFIDSLLIHHGRRGYYSRWRHIMSKCGTWSDNVFQNRLLLHYISNNNNNNNNNNYYYYY